MAFLCRKLIESYVKQNFHRIVRNLHKNSRISLHNINLYKRQISSKWKITQKLPKFSPTNYTTCTNNDNGGRHLYHADVENAVNQQILTEFNASYAYLSMSAFFGRTDIALPGCQGFFYDMYLEETEHAIVLMNYQLMRGGYVTLLPIEAPEKEFKGIEYAFETGLKMEKQVKEKITSVMLEAEKHADHQLVDFLVSQYLKEQNESIKKMARWLTRAKKMVSNPDGEFFFDKQLYSNYVKDDNLMFTREVPVDIDKKYS